MKLIQELGIRLKRVAGTMDPNHPGWNDLTSAWAIYQKLADESPCRIDSKRDLEMNTRLRCQFEWVKSECDADEFVIRDIGPHNVFLTVTNDVEAVVRYLIELGEIGDSKPGRRLFYYDSEGYRDEINFSGDGTFLGFTVGER